MTNELSSHADVVDPEGKFKTIDGGLSGYVVRVSTEATRLERAVVASNSMLPVVVCQCDGTAKEVRACMARNADDSVFPPYDGGFRYDGPIINEVISSCARVGHKVLEGFAASERKEMRSPIDSGAVR
jgi:hypothetical protein